LRFQDLFFLKTAALRARRIMDITPRPCTACTRLENGAYCTHYRHVMPEPLRLCRCVHFKEALPWDSV
jgi:hypothetical protein